MLFAMGITAIAFYFVAVSMGVFGYRRGRWWMPAVAAMVCAVFSAFWFYAAHFSWQQQAGRGVPTFDAVLLRVGPLSLAFNLALFYAAYSVGRGVARWRKGRA